ncbi:conserved hypothetical protein [Trichinella spiralis]|uniref:hypothetical protein n=1 Tax=Trichinella spiralis TaxID=6334 RepID=UPI0001EFB542|nr:conserved hypothetical protein [Trichinella spiralis]
MPRHLISNAYEWINKIPSVPIYYLAKPQPRERSDSVKRHERCSTDMTGLSGDRDSGIHKTPTFSRCSERSRLYGPVDGV